jgi:glycosyltransferase involved in cell wall biosynthesis
VSPTHLVLIPSYNTGARLFQTVGDACAAWSPVWVVIDGSTDGSGDELRRRTEEFPGLRVFELPRNRGKGAAVEFGLREARSAGFTHVLTMDADGQHPADRIADFMAASMADPRALILGKPVFDASAPPERVAGRRIANFCADVETLWAGIGDCLFGFRVYPVADLLAVMRGNPFMRRFDFDPEAAVRLCWRGLKPVDIPAAVRYFRPDEGGVSHFNYLRDNLWLSWMFLRLLAGFLVRLPWLVWLRMKK